MHGGTTEEDIFKIVKRAIKLATENKRKKINATVVFFDEANTTDAIATVKSVMCDRLVDGEPIPSGTLYGIFFLQHFFDCPGLLFRYWTSICSGRKPLQRAHVSFLHTIPLEKFSTHLISDLK